MNKSHFLVAFLIMFAISVCKGQHKETDILMLSVYCYDSKITIDGKSNKNRPVFVLGIRNNGMRKVELYQEILFGHASDTLHNDITFELYYLKDRDTINVLDKILMERTRSTKRQNKIILYSTECYLFEFNLLDAFYLKRPGKYLIRFTLLKHYAEEQLTRNISTDWIPFEVGVVEITKENNY